VKPILPLQLVAYEHLKDMILNDTFDYGVVYSETKLSKEIGVSRTPLRDAIQRLVQEKYIDIIPSKGFQLHQMDEKDIIETYQFRSALEGFCTVQIAKDYQTDKAACLFSDLSELLLRQEKIHTTTGSIEEFTLYDNQFHIKIIDYLDNNVFREAFAIQIHMIKRLAMQSLSHEGRMQETLSEHYAMFNAMKNGETENIYNVTLQHMDKPKNMNLQDIL